MDYTTDSRHFECVEYLAKLSTFLFFPSKAWYISLFHIYNGYLSEEAAATAIKRYLLHFYL